MQNGLKRRKRRFFLGVTLQDFAIDIRELSQVLEDERDDRTCGMVCRKKQANNLSTDLHFTLYITIFMQ